MINNNSNTKQNESNPMAIYNGMSMMDIFAAITEKVKSSGMLFAEEMKFQNSFISQLLKKAGKQEALDALKAGKYEAKEMSNWFVNALKLSWEKACKLARTVIDWFKALYTSCKAGISKLFSKQSDDKAVKDNVKTFQATSQRVAA